MKKNKVDPRKNAGGNLKAATTKPLPKQVEKGSGSRVLMGVYLQNGKIYVHLNKVIGNNGAAESKLSYAKICLFINKKELFKHELQVRHNTRDPVYDETIKVKGNALMY